MYAFYICDTTPFLQTADKAPPAKKGRGRPKKVRIEEQQPPVEKMETDESEGVAVQESPESHDEQEVREHSHSVHS